jgi:hypothetical protein
MQFQLPAVPAGEMTPFVQSAMQLRQAVLEENAQLREDVALLRDEVAALKGHKPRPKFKGSNLVKAIGKDGAPRAGAGRAERVLVAALPIHEDRIVRALAVPEDVLLTMHGSGSTTIPCRRRAWNAPKLERRSSKMFFPHPKKRPGPTTTRQASS